jgi:hypothetical protein
MLQDNISEVPAFQSQHILRKFLGLMPHVRALGVGHVSSPLARTLSQFDNFLMMREKYWRTMAVNVVTYMLGLKIF